MMKRTVYRLIFLVYPLVDFAILVFAIMFSYKLYRMMGIGKHVYSVKSA